ncbi:MAG: hypothetical protein LBO65_09875 [Spirochaetaceae bacterium]|jgi:adenylate cyclase class IV|nr:hypothetical protein [Spirochaetaceae bacterium]
MGKNIEIEIKARIEDPAVCKERLEGLAGEGAAFVKEDAYWLPLNEKKSGRVPPVSAAPLPPSGVRVRRERRTGGEVPEQTWVTYKIQESGLDGIEVNEEHEFEVSGGDEFEEFLTRLGLTRGIRKRKGGWKWRHGNITAELAEVAGDAPPAPPRNLGWFVELEILADPAEAETAPRAAGAELLQFLGLLGIAKENIEPRRYSQLLAARG